MRRPLRPTTPNTITDYPALYSLRRGRLTAAPAAHVRPRIHHQLLLMTALPNLRVVTVAALVLFAGAATAQPVDTERVSALAVLLLDIGADGAALADLAESEAHDQATLQALGPERSAILREAWTSAFAEEQLRKDVVDHIASRESAVDAAEGVAWLRRPEVARATDKMRSGTGRSFEAEFGRWVMGLEDDDVDAERVHHIAVIAERSGEDRVGAMVMKLAEASLRGAHAVAPRSGRPSLDAALGRLSSLAPTITTQAVTQNQLYLYYVLRDLSLRELEAYADALDSRAGQWYVRAMHSAFAHAIDRGSERLVREADAATTSLR